MDKTCFFFIVFRIFYFYSRKNIAVGNNRCYNEWSLMRRHDATELQTQHLKLGRGDLRENWTRTTERERERERERECERERGLIMMKFTSMIKFCILLKIETRKKRFRLRFVIRNLKRKIFENYIIQIFVMNEIIRFHLS